MKKLLIADTETNGLPVCYTANFRDTANWPRITQFAWELCYEDGTTISKFCEMVKPDGWTIPKTEFFKEQGFTTEGNEEDGWPMEYIMGEFIDAFEQADLLICHNLSFDLAVIQSEMYRYRLKPSKSIAKYCTKLESTGVCKIKGFGNKYKWPSLEEAYTFFFGKMPEGAHKADFDVWACKQVYLKLVSLNKKQLNT